MWETRGRQGREGVCGRLEGDKGGRVCVCVRLEGDKGGRVCVGD